MTNAPMNTYSPRSLLRINKEEWTEQDIYQLQKVIERFGNNRNQVYEFFSNKSEQQFEAMFLKYSTASANTTSTDRSSRPTTDATTITASTDRSSRPTTDATTKRRQQQQLQRRRSKQIRRSTTPHHHETAVEFEIEAGIMNDIAERLIDLDDDSYIDEEDLDDAEDEDVDNHKDVQSMVNFKPGAAMTTDEVRVRLKELQVITAEQFNSPDLNIRFAEENDFSARTKKELQ